MRILVVEDEKGVAKFIKQGLSEAGYAVDTAGDGEEGLDHIAVMETVRLFLNLMDNALKYTEPDGEIGISMKYEGSYICVAVSNTGKMIPDKNVSHIFDRFYRVMLDRSRETGGSGLGLAIVREIVNTHNGRIEVKSDPGNVITFITCLPAGKS